MSLKVADVLATLNDRVTQGMFFWVGSTYVNANDYNAVRDNILNGNIMVLDGKPDQTLAFYNASTDILTTQNATPPADVGQRALLLHECTHALVDYANNGYVTRHLNELAAYFAQVVYMARSMPGWTMPDNPDPKWAAFFHGVFDMVKDCRLDSLDGNGAGLDSDKLEPLRVQLAALPGVDYGGYAKDTPAGADGVFQYGPIASAVRRKLSGL